MSDYQLEDSVYFLFTTRAFATGIPGTLSAATVAVYEDVTATPIETSIAVTETLNSIAGLNAVTIAALAASGYNAGGHYHVVIEAGEVDSVSVIGEVVGNFTIESAPVVWAKVAAPTTAVDLSATDIQLVDTATALTNVINNSSIVASISGNVDGNVTGSVGSNLELGPSEVNAEVDTALTDIHLDHLLAVDAADVVVDASVIAHMVSTTEDWSTFVPSTDSLQTIRDELTNVPKSDGTTTWNATALGSINTQVDLGLTDIHLDHLLAVDAADVVVDASVIAHMVSATEDWSTFVPSTDSLQAMTDQIVVIDGNVDDIETDTAEIGSAVGASISADIAALFTTVMTESYNTDGSDATPAQALYVIMQALTDFSISGTTITFRQLDGSTTAYTGTLSDATNPVSLTRAT